MQTIEVTATDFRDAVPLPNKRERPVAKRQKAASNVSGSRGARRTSYLPRLSGKFLAEQQKIDQAVTAGNRMLLVITPSGKRRFIREADYQAGM